MHDFADFAMQAGDSKSQPPGLSLRMHELVQKVSVCGT